MVRRPQLTKQGRKEDPPRMRSVVQLYPGPLGKLPNLIDFGVGEVLRFEQLCEAWVGFWVGNHHDRGGRALRAWGRREAGELGGFLECLWGSPPT